MLDVAKHGLLAIAVGDEHFAVAGVRSGSVVDTLDRLRSTLEDLDARVNPRWVWWSKDTVHRLIEVGYTARRCWDLGAVHRVLFGGWQSSPAHIWAALNDLNVEAIPVPEPINLFNHRDDVGDPADPVGPDGYLRPDWVRGGWTDDATKVARWAELAADAQDRQGAVANEIVTRSTRPALSTTMLSESAAELLCAELEADGLPIDVEVAERIIGEFVGPRPTSPQEAADQLARRDADVLAHLPAGTTFDLRSPDQVKSLLRRVGIEVPDTRAWRLERLRDAHPVVEPLLAWRRAERILTTFGYHWLDAHVSQGRLRGEWSGSDGAAGRMTAGAGLHNMPAELRPAVVAEAGHLFVRADLGQIEPRILAAVSGDARLIAATDADDMYAPVAQQLGVEREIAKVAVLGAMYGQTTGTGAEALRGLEREYPDAMGFLKTADRAAQGGHDLRTVGGRLVRTGASTTAATIDNDADRIAARSRAAARGRFGRNALIQGAAAEFFKTWAVLVRARAAPLDARVVLCLHDELLVHTPADRANQVADLVDSCLDEAAHRWLHAAHADAAPARFVSDTSIISTWADAKH